MNRKNIDSQSESIRVKRAWLILYSGVCPIYFVQLNASLNEDVPSPNTIYFWIPSSNSCSLLLSKL